MAYFKISDKQLVQVLEIGHEFVKYKLNHGKTIKTELLYEEVPDSISQEHGFWVGDVFVELDKLEKPNRSY
jgi:hypothetical protein